MSGKSERPEHKEPAVKHEHKLHHEHIMREWGGDGHKHQKEDTARHKGGFIHEQDDVKRKHNL